MPVLGLACGSGREPDRPAPAPLRLLRPPAGASTAALPRAQLGGESRYVLAAHPATTLRSQEEVRLPEHGPLRAAATLPASLAGREVRLDAWASARDPDAPSGTLVEMREGGRVRTAAAPLVVEGTGGAAPTLDVPVPAALAGSTGLLTVVARPLPPALLVSETDEEPIPPGARLRFGYGVEEPGWTPGWAPVRFSVRATPAGGEPVTLFERRVDPAADPRDRRWFDASVDLAPVAGRRIRFRFEAEALAGAPGVTVGRSFPVVSDPVVVPASPRASRPNLILVSLDTLRARSVSAYGNARPTTPTLDRRVAQAGALVRSAVTPWPFTPPAHMTMLTGLEPCAHGMKDLHTALPANYPTLAETLRATGYRTAAFTEDAYLVAGNGFDRGFDTYVENRSEESPSPGFAVETFGAALRWLEADTREPFFLFVHTYQVHEPYAPPRGYRDLFPDSPPAGEHQQALRAYEQEVRYTDDLVADVLDVLDARGLAARTVLVVTSDHGEQFGEHFWTGHGFDLHDEAVLVPLLVRAPGLVPPGRVVEPQVTLADLAPTLLDLLGLPPLPAAQGRSFAGLLTGRDAAFEERPAVLAATSGERAVRTRRSKWIEHPNARFFYDLAQDPLERRNLIDQNPPGLAEARAAHAAAEAACAEWRATHPPVATATPGAPDGEPGWLVNREEIERKLKSLGYVQ